MLLILLEIFPFSMLFLVSAGPRLGQSIEERRFTSACPLAPRAVAKRCTAKRKIPVGFSIPTPANELKQPIQPNRLGESFTIYSKCRILYRELQHFLALRGCAGQPGPRAENREWGEMEARWHLAGRVRLCDARSTSQRQEKSLGIDTSYFSWIAAGSPSKDLPGETFKSRPRLPASRCRHFPDRCVPAPAAPPPGPPTPVDKRFPTQYVQDSAS